MITYPHEEGGIITRMIGGVLDGAAGSRQD